MGRTSIQVSDRLADELHSRKDRGDSYEDVIWRLIDREGENVDEREEDGIETPSDPPHGVDRQRLADELPGSGGRLEARVDAIVTMYDLLREQREATKAELLDAIDVEATGYASPASVWSNMVKGKDTLAALPGVEPPSTGMSTWRYVGDRDE
jgi:hypothetical protein